MKVAVVGGVVSTEVLVQTLVRHGFSQLRVWGYEPADTAVVSGWRDLRELTSSLGLPFEGFRKVTECENSLRAFAPDIMFVVGLSQIIPRSIMNITNKVNIGFHPTALPRGRGRAALAWLILHGENGAATFFEMGDGVDDGPVFVQEPFDVAESDNTADVEAKLLIAEKKALDRWLPLLAQGDLSATHQDHSKATWLGRRSREDGWLNWQEPSDSLLRLIRASAPPHPGAYTFCENHEIVVIKAKYSDRPEIGVPGRILRVHTDGGFEVQAGDGIVHVTDWQTNTGWTPRPGALLGFYTEAEIFDLRARLAALERTVDDLKAIIGRKD